MFQFSTAHWCERRIGAASGQAGLESLASLEHTFRMGSDWPLMAIMRHPCEAGRLRFISSNLAGCSLARIVEEELIAVGIIDHQKPVAPRTLLDRNALGLEFRAQRVQRGDRGLVRLPARRSRK